MKPTEHPLEFSLGEMTAEQLQDWARDRAPPGYTSVHIECGNPECGHRFGIVMHRMDDRCHCPECGCTLIVDPSGAPRQ